MILDLEDSIAPERKAHARAAALEYPQGRASQEGAPAPAGAHQRPRHRHDRRRSRRHRAGAPDAILFPKAEGGATVTHLDAKLTAREAIAGLPEGSIKILAQTVESAPGLFTAGTYRNASPRLIGMTWGPEDLSAELGAEANREADGTLTEPYRLARSFCLFGAAAAKVPAIETIHVDFRNRRRACAATPKWRAATVLPGAWRSIRRRCR